VNATFVRRYLAKQNPLGKRLRQGNNEGSSGDSAIDKPKSSGWIIAGVVGDAKYENLRREIHPTVYLPLTGGGAHFELRTAADPAPLIPAVRDVVNRVASNLPLFDVHKQSEKIDQLLTEERVIARLSGFFGLLALMLSCIGLYGLLSYEVSRRTREIGIRMALGAERSHVLKIVLREGVGLTLVGVLFGIAAALGLTRLMASLLYDVQPTDPATFAIVGLALSGVAIAASYIPARRATKVDPMVALRYE
jgi:predicted lysophospholipase L1 biosynthesis ABC-type transport system permease subunit